jgi:hypothetical protein
VRCSQTQRVLGGIAIVFKAAGEFRAMLHDVLEVLDVLDVLDVRDGIAAIVGADGRFIASTDASQAPAMALNMDARQSIVEYQSSNRAPASAQAVGYREFNAGGGYQHGVNAVVALRLGALEHS